MHMKRLLDNPLAIVLGPIILMWALFFTVSLAVHIDGHTWVLAIEVIALALQALLLYRLSARIRNNEAQLARKQPSDRTSGKLKALAVLLVLLFLASNAAIRFFGSEMLNPGIRMLLRASTFMAFILPYGFIWSVTRGSKG